MKNRNLLFLFLGILPLWVLGQASPQIKYPFVRVIQEGDNMAWADPGFDHTHWDGKGYINSIGNYWVRFRINIDPSDLNMQHPGIQVISTGAYEIFWDGIKIGENGKVGANRETEIPGQFISQLLIPDSLLSPGEHSVAFRVSNYHWPDWGFPTWNQFYLEEYLSSRLSDLALASWVFILAGLYLMTAVYYLLIYFLRKRERVTLIFSGICFLFFALILIEYAKFFYQYPYPLHPVRLGIILLLNLSITFLMPLFFLMYFHIPFKRILSLAIFMAAIGIIYFNLFNLDGINQILGEVMWVNSLLIVSYAVWKKKKESWVMLTAVVLAGLVVRIFPVALSSMIHSYDVTLFLGFSILVLAMIYLLVRRAREQRLAYEASLLLSSRLQNELLKKNIQPHFIMNTLTSLMEWVEESPKESVNFIESLAKEFEIMSEIAEEKLIPLEQEIALCQEHMAIMRYRKEIPYQLTHDPLPQGRQVPPAIFHTIVENGLSHSVSNGEGIRIHLSFPEKAGFIGYALHTFAQNRKTEATQDGTGHKYIRSRLTENYGKGWEMTSQATEEGWLTQIFIQES